MSSVAKADAIPQELMDEARSVTDEWFATDVGSISADSLMALIACALMARDQRAADIVNGWAPFPRPTSRSALYWLREVAKPAIATAILTQEKPHG